MSCLETGMREDAAFAALARAVEQRQRISAKLAIYDDHWEGYEAATTGLDRAIQAYSLVLEALREARSRHKDIVSA
jgi:hypothetical protein